MGDVAHAIGAVARGAGYGLLAHHGGHGIGREMHEAPSVPNDGAARTGIRLHPGLVIALEPMLIAGGRRRLPWSTQTAGRSVPPTAPAPPTSSTPWRSPRPARGS